MLVDTNVVVDFLRGEEKAMDFFKGTETKRILVINWMEIVIGLPGKQGKIRLDKFFKSVGMEVVQIDEIISNEAGEILFDYRQKLGLDIADAFLAAAARVLNEKVCTLNMRHFKGISGVEVVRPY